MKVKSVAGTAASFFFCVMIDSLALAQEGHPMTGSWVGYWESGAQERHRVVVVLEWSQQQLSGTINPGPDAIPIRSASVDPRNWSLHIEADGVDAQGRPAAIVADGTLDDLGTYNRTIAGTWNVGSMQGNFSITRQ